MNNRKHINNMGTSKISDFNQRVIKRFKEYNPDLTRGLSDREIFISFEDSASFAFTRLSIATNGMGYAIQEAIVECEKEDSFLRKIYNRITK